MDDLLCTISRVDVEDRADLYIHVPKWCVKNDPFEWTLRFRLGDQVVCRTGGIWKAAIVEVLWPNTLACYRCRETISSGYADILTDSDTYIMKHPMSFRFSRGDEVIFSSTEATGLTNTNLEPWIRGTITRVDIVGLKDNYAVYECTFMDRHQTKKCLILEDDDSHVARLGVSPRQRLLDAIEQHCAGVHITYLVTTFDMNVMAFRDLLVTKATESGNSYALFWLQENASVDLERIRDAEGNGLLHQISRMPFFEQMSIVEIIKERLGDKTRYRSIELDNTMSNKKDRLIRQKNNKGQLGYMSLSRQGTVELLILLCRQREVWHGGFRRGSYMKPPAFAPH
jgi:hypothetical protein